MSVFKSIIAKKDELVAKKNELHAKKYQLMKEADVLHPTMRFKIAGVSYRNADKTSRQEILKELYRNHRGIFGKKRILAFPYTYTYKREPAIGIGTVEGDVGNIAAKEVSAVTALLPYEEYSTLDIEEMWDLYSAHVVMVMDHQPDNIISLQDHECSELNLIDEIPLAGHTGASPYGCSVRALLYALIGSPIIDLSFGEHPDGKDGYIYVYANNLASCYIPKKDTDRFKDLISRTDKIQFCLTVTPTGAGRSDNYKASLKFYE